MIRVFESTRTQHLTIKPFLTACKGLVAASAMMLASQTQAQAQVLTEFTLDNSNATVSSFSTNLANFSTGAFTNIFDSNGPFFSDPANTYNYTT